MKKLHRSFCLFLALLISLSLLTGCGNTASGTAASAPAAAPAEEENNYVVSCGPIVVGTVAADFLATVEVTLNGEPVTVLESFLNCSYWDANGEASYPRLAPSDVLDPKATGCTLVVSVEKPFNATPDNTHVIDDRCLSTVTIEEDTVALCVWLDIDPGEDNNYVVSFAPMVVGTVAADFLATVEVTLNGEPVTVLESFLVCNYSDASGEGIHTRLAPSDVVDSSAEGCFLAIEVEKPFNAVPENTYLAQNGLVGAATVLEDTIALDFWLDLIKEQNDYVVNFDALKLGMRAGALLNSLTVTLNGEPVEVLTRSLSVVKATADGGIENVALADGDVIDNASESCMLSLTVAKPANAYPETTHVESSDGTPAATVKEDCIAIDIWLSVAHQHTYKLSSQVASTCSTPGKAVFTCTICGNSYSETLLKKPHTAGSLVSCAADGHTLTCSVCGQTYTTSHSFSYDCSKNNNYHICRCTVCGYSYNESCTGDRYCSRCGGEIVIN